MSVRHSGLHADEFPFRLQESNCGKDADRLASRAGMNGRLLYEDVTCKESAK